MIDLKHAEIVVLDIDDIRPTCMVQVEGRQPVPCGISGVTKKGKYLVDGHHRVQWMRDNGVKHGVFINLF